jgi:hypothetical protein
MPKIASGLALAALGTGANNMRYYEIVEMAPSPEVRAMPLYHGTKTEEAAKSILANGIQPGAVDRGKGHLAPVAGKVYLTPSIEYATIYALGGVWMTHKMRPEYLKGSQYGYVFVIDGNALTHIQPDEDSVGEFIYKHSERKRNPITGRYIGWEFRPDGVDEQEKRRVYYNVKNLMTPRQYVGSCDGYIAAHAAGGKRALKKLSDQDKACLVKWGSHIAHDGAITPVACWKIDKMRSVEIAKDGSNFFDIAERIL